MCERRTHADAHLLHKGAQRQTGQQMHVDGPVGQVFGKYNVQGVIEACAAKHPPVNNDAFEERFGSANYRGTGTVVS